MAVGAGHGPGMQGFAGVQEQLVYEYLAKTGYCKNVKLDPESFVQKLSQPCHQTKC